MSSLNYQHTFLFCLPEHMGFIFQHWLNTRIMSRERHRYLILLMLLQTGPRCKEGRGLVCFSGHFPVCIIWCSRSDPDHTLPLMAQRNILLYSLAKGECVTQWLQGVYIAKENFLFISREKREKHQRIKCGPQFAVYFCKWRALTALSRLFLLTSCPLGI